MSSPSAPLSEACAALEAAVPDVNRVLSSLSPVDRLWAALFVMTSATFNDRPFYRAPALSALRGLLVGGLASLLEDLLLGFDAKAALVGVACVRELSPELSESDLGRLMQLVIERPPLAKEAAVMWLLAGVQDDRWYRVLSSAGGEHLLPLLPASEDADRIARSLLAGRGGL